MKNLVVIIIAIFLTSFVPQTGMAQNDRDQIEVKVEGLGCPFCAYGLEKKFKDFKGIKDVKIEMETGLFTFSYPTDKKITVDQIEKKVDDAGYTAVATQINRADGTVESNTDQKEAVEIDMSKVTETTFFVAGNCGMCEARIENTAKDIAGVVDADWDVDTKMLTVSLDPSQTSDEVVAKSVAASGHDTKFFKAEMEVYKKLPGCCQYDRVEE